MLTEAITMGAILACSGSLTWVAMKKYHSSIEKRLREIETHTTELEVKERRFRR